MQLRGGETNTGVVSIGVQCQWKLQRKKVPASVEPVEQNFTVASTFSLKFIGDTTVYNHQGHHQKRMSKKTNH